MLVILFPPQEKVAKILKIFKITDYGSFLNMGSSKEKSKMAVENYDETNCVSLIITHTKPNIFTQEVDGVDNHLGGLTVLLPPKINFGTNSPVSLMLEHSCYGNVSPFVIFLLISFYVCKENVFWLVTVGPRSPIEI